MTQRGRFGGPRRARKKHVSFSRRRRTPAFGRQNVRTGGFQGLEKKFVDTVVTGDAFTGNWATIEDATLDSISGIAQGNGESQRIGRKVLLHSVHIKCIVRRSTVESNATPQGDITGRLCLVLDTQTNAAQLTATDVMKTVTADELSFRNLQNVSRFRVLWDRKWKLSVSSSGMNEGAANLFATGAQRSAIMIFNKRFKTPIPVLYNSSATDGTISTVQDNSLHIIGVASDGNAFLEMVTRIRYTG